MVLLDPMLQSCLVAVCTSTGPSVIAIRHAQKKWSFCDQETISNCGLEISAPGIKWPDQPA